MTTASKTQQVNMITAICYGITVLFYLGLVLFNFPKPRLSGDGAMGYGLGIAFFGLGFAISSVLLVISLTWQGGLNWVSANTGTRNLLAGAGWLCIVLATFFSAVFKWEWHAGEFPIVLRWVAQARGETWMPLFLLVPAWFMMRSASNDDMIANTMQVVMKSGVAAAGIFCLLLLYGWMTATVRNQQTNAKLVQESVNHLQQQHLRYIAEQRPEDPVVNILSLTGRFHEDVVRNAAVASVKSHPDWEAQLIDLLNNGYAHTEVYQFIDGNAVDHPELFVEPLNRSIRRLAVEVKTTINEASYLQNGQFGHIGLDRLLRAIDEQFSAPGMDFRPALQELLAAFKTPPPERFRDVRFNTIPILESWLRKHK